MDKKRIHIGDNFSFGNISNSNVQIKNKNNNVRNVINDFAEEDKLDALIDRLSETLNQARSIDVSAADAGLVALRQLAEEAQKHNPNQYLLRSYTDNFKRMAELFSDTYPEIINQSKLLVSMIMKG